MLKFLWNAFIAKLRILNMVKCECGCRDDHWVVRGQIEGIICEASIVCDNCGKETNYWAYGNTQYPETYTELIKWNLADFLYKFNLVRRYQNWRFNRSIRKGGF